MNVIVKAGAGLAAVGAAGTMSLVFMAGAVLGGTVNASTVPLTPIGCVPAGGTVATPSTLTAEQTTNAATIVAVGTQMGVPTPGLEVALITAIQESGLRNLPYGDRDSLGLFQQRPSQGWGTVTQIMNPTYSSGKFYTALLAVPGWAMLLPGVAAQTVQRSAFPSAYAPHIPLALAILGTTAVCTPVGGPGPTVPGPAGLTMNGSPAGDVAARFALAQLGKPYVWGATGPNSFDCSGLMLAAWAAAGVTISRVTYTQVADGTPVPLSAVRTGDLVLIPGSDGTPSNPGHVGMVAGTDTAGAVWMAEASRPGVPIRLTALADWVPQIVTIRRIG